MVPLSRAFVRDLAVIWAFGLALLSFLIWLGAFAHGGRITVRINDYGEMWPELAMWIVVLPVLAVGLHYYLETVVRG